MFHYDCQQETRKPLPRQSLQLSSVGRFMDPTPGSDSPPGAASDRALQIPHTTRSRDQPEADAVIEQWLAAADSDDQEAADELLGQLSLDDRRGRLRHYASTERTATRAEPAEHIDEEPGRRRVRDAGVVARTAQSSATDARQQQKPATGGSQAIQIPQPADEVQDLLADLNALLPDASPLRLLQHRVEAFFKKGTRMASFAFAALENVAMEGIYELDEERVKIELSTTEPKPESEYIKNYPWTSCKLAATLVMILAASKEGMYDAIKSQSRHMGGMPRLKDIRETPSASFVKEFRIARDAALGKEKSATVMQVTLTDVCIFELEEQGQFQEYFEFSHVFVVGVGPEGVTVWQAWGKHGYRLDEYLGRNGTRVRNWKEAEQFVDDFEKLILGKVSMRGGTAVLSLNTPD